MSIPQDGPCGWGPADQPNIDRCREITQELKSIEAEQREVDCQIQSLPPSIDRIDYDVSALQSARASLVSQLNSSCPGYLLSCGTKLPPLKDSREHDLTVQIQDLDRQIQAKKDEQERLRRELDSAKSRASSLRQEHARLSDERRRRYDAIVDPPDDLMRQARPVGH